MTERFEIGEVAIYVRPDSPYHGKEVTIAGPLETVTVNYDRGVPCNPYEITAYRVIGDWPQRVLHWACPINLRKKKPRRELDQKVSWDECLWKPKNQEVMV